MGQKSLLLAFLFLASSAANAACPGTQPTGTDCVNAAATKTINAHSNCRSITNNHATGRAIMIPINTSAEWTRFYSNLPGGVTASACSLMVSSVSPMAAIAVGGASVTVTGSGFVNGAVVRIGGTNCSTSTFVSATQMTCIVPAAAAGTISNVDISVTNPDTTSASIANGFFYLGAPKTWLRADVGVSTSGSNVTTWADGSGNGNVATSSPSPPTFVSSSSHFNNKPVVNFSGTSLMELAKLDVFQNVSGATSVGAFRPTSTGNNQAIFSYWNGGDGNERFAFVINSQSSNPNRGTSPTGNFFIHTTREDSTAYEYIRGGTLAVNTPVILGGIVNFASRTAELAVNGTVVSTGSNLLTAGSTSNTPSLNANFGGADTYYYYYGDVAELLLYSFAITSTQRQVLENYLKAKYNLP